MLKITIPIVGDAIIEVTGSDNKEILEQASFWMTLPKVYPECGAALILSYRRPQNFPYYGLICTGETPHECNFGVRRDDGSLFYNPIRKTWRRAGAKFDEPEEFDEPQNTNHAGNVTPIKQAATSFERKNIIVRIKGFCTKINANGGEFCLPSDMPRRDAWSLYKDSELAEIEKSAQEQLDFLVRQQRKQG